MPTQEQLSPEEDQEREVYARYGSAMYYGQSLEAVIKGALVLANLRDATISTQDEFDDVWTNKVQANDANGVALNTWLRGGAPLNPTSFQPVEVGTGGALVSGDTRHPLKAIFEVADIGESARNSGKWKPGYAGDGVHPTSTGSAALAAAVDISCFGI